MQTTMPVYAHVLRLAAITVGVLAILLTGAGHADAAKFGQRTLKKGMSGRDVRALQRSLTQLKVPTPVTGHFGAITKQNVRTLEEMWSWPVDGRVQRAQAKKIKGIIGKRKARKRRTGTTTAGVFPVPDTHNFGGSEARFGAGRSGHSHQGQDVFAACGSRLLSATAGVVKAREYQAGGAGYYVVVDGSDGYDYVYMHLVKNSWAVKGTTLYAGQQIGKVGDSGNASGCHLHFEMWSAPGWYTGGAPFDPLPSLYHWDSYS
jgi:murein DD-endopeptidase MepM/ murein hydrolase activator NlpD